MKEKEKAIYLVKRYSCLHHGIDEDLLENVVVSDYAIESALIAVDEIIKYCKFYDVIYWQEVKNEIEKL
jgi:hypothetical protein